MCGHHFDLFAIDHEHGLGGVPHVAQTLAHAALGVGGIRGAQGEHTSQDDEGGDEQHRHAPLAEPLDAFADAAENHIHIGQDSQGKEHQLAAAAVEQRAIARETNVVREEVAVLTGSAQVQVAHGGVPGIADGPAFQRNVVHGDADGGDHAGHAEVFPAGFAADEVEDAGGGVATQCAALAADGPFHPAQGDTQQQEGGEVGNHEGAAAVLGCQAGEAQEITEPDGAAGHSQYYAQVGVPVFCFLVGTHGRL